MTVRRALRTAVSDFYSQSWRLFVLNAALSACAIAVAVAAFYVPLAIVLVIVLGPLAAALMHCAVTLAQTEDLRLADAADGLRLHWRRGLVLAAIAAVVIGVGAYAALFYAEGGTWPLSVLVADLVLLFVVLQLVLWPLAVHERARPLREVVRAATVLSLRRLGALLGLALVLLVVNTAGLAAAFLPFLTLTIAYTFLAAAHFTLPPSPTREA